MNEREQSAFEYLLYKCKENEVDYQAFLDKIREKISISFPKEINGYFIENEIESVLTENLEINIRIHFRLIKHYQTAASYRLFGIAQRLRIIEDLKYYIDYFTEQHFPKLFDDILHSMIKWSNETYKI